MIFNKMVAVCVCVTAFYASAQFNPQVRSVKSGWSQWGAQVSSMHFESTVSGIVSRTVLTISFKDVQSAEGTDSMEVNFNFNLPPKSVIDSMYLWINGKPQNAALKEYWSAVSAYWQVVGRRWDPALLTKWSNDSYNLRIFPFSHGEERTVRICYSTPLAVTDGKLSIQFPVDMAAGSVRSVNAVSGKVTFEKPAGRITVTAQQGIASTIPQENNDTVVTVTFGGENILPIQTLRMFIEDIRLKDKGMCTYITKKDSTDASFITILDPKLITGAVNNRPKNIFVIWNMVSEYVNYICNGNCYSYDTSTTNAFYYDEYAVNNTMKGLSVLLSTYMQNGDKFNLILNDGSSKQLFEQQTGWTPELQSRVQEFVDTKIGKVYSSNVSLSPSEFLNTSLKGISNEKFIDLIVIDQTYSYRYNLDTLKIDSQSNQLLKMLPENTTVFGLISYDWYNPMARVQNTLIQRKNGMAFYSWGDQEEIFGSIGRSLSPRIFPASVTFSCGNDAFVYDANGPVDDRIFYGVPVIYTGKIRGSTDSLNVNFTYDLNGAIYQKKADFPVTFTASNFDPVEKIWAAARVEKLLYKSSPYAYNDYSDALNVSLKYRILTNQTALIAFEPGLMSDSWYKDDQPKGNIIGDNVLPVQTAQKIVPMQPVMTAFVKNGQLNISIDGIGKNTKSKQLGLKLFDLKGRLIADLSNKITILNSKITLEMKSSSLATGIYIVRFTCGKTVLQRTVTIR